MEIIDDTVSGPTALGTLGKYELLSRVAAGGMAEVYLARLRGPMNFQKLVIVKRIHPHLASQREFLKMLLDEARLSALIKHPNVVDVYELGSDNGVYFIAMEYLDGQPMAKLMSAGVAGRPLDPLSTTAIIADAAAGLHAAHELESLSGRPLGLVHRDVSPGNIMVLYNGRAKIVDFGIAKARGRLTASGATQFKGKLGYVAPEQLTGQVDRRTDVYSLGVVMWEALTLQRLYPPEREHERVRGTAPPPPRPSELADVPPALDEVCLRALEPDPDDRYQTAHYMKLALLSALRALDYERESDGIRSYMHHVFSAQRAARRRLLRRASTSTGEFDLNEFESALTDATPAGDEIVIEYGDDELVTGDEDTEAAALLPRYEGTAEPTAPRRGGRTGLVAALVVLVAGAAVAAFMYMRGAKADEDPKARDERAAAASADSEDGEPTAGQRRDELVTEPPATDPAATADAIDPQPAARDDDERDDSARSDGKRGDDKKDDRKKDDRKKDDQKKDDDSSKSATAAQLYEEGSNLFVRGKLSEAKAKFKAALAINSRFAPALRGLGLIYQREGRKDAAIRYFKKYLRASPNAGDAASIRDRIEQLER